MNEFLSRTDKINTPAAPNSRRPAVRAVSAPAASGHAGGQGRRDHQDRRDKEESQYSPAAEFARAQKKISDVLADLHSDNGNAADADAAISALLPQPVAPASLPPGDREQMDHAVAVASALRQDVPLARKAQAHVPTATAEAVIT